MCACFYKLRECLIERPTLFKLYMTYCCFVSHQTKWIELTDNFLLLQRTLECCLTYVEVCVFFSGWNEIRNVLGIGCWGSFLRRFFMVKYLPSHSVFQAPILLVVTWLPFFIYHEWENKDGWLSPHWFSLFISQSWDCWQPHQ